MLRLKNKVAFITGGGGGIGRATAERFAEEGAKVIIAEITPEIGEAAALSACQKGKDSGGDAHFIETDVRNAESVKAAIEQTISRYGQLNILHNNAGGSTLEDGPVTEAPVEEFWRCIGLDLFGTFLCSKHAIPKIAASGGGSIINMSSNVALMALPGRDCYTAAKGAIASMTRSMAAEYASDNIRVNAIAPGMILTPMNRNRFETNSDFRTMLLDATPLGRVGAPEDIANGITFLCSDEAAFISGHTLTIDGAWSTTKYQPFDRSLHE